MSTLTDSSEYKALCDSLDGLAERGLFCALVALFRSLFALLAAIKSGAILLPPPPVVEPRAGSASVSARPKGVDGRDEHDHDADDTGLRVRGTERQVRRRLVAAAVARPLAEAIEQLPSHIEPEIRLRAVHERVPAAVQNAGARVYFRDLPDGSDAIHEEPIVPWVTVDRRCFRNGLGTPGDNRAQFVTI